MLRSTFGRYPDMTLAQARQKAPEVLADMADGSPQGQRKADLFKVVLEEWLKKIRKKQKLPTSKNSDVPPRYACSR